GDPVRAAGAGARRSPRRAATALSGRSPHPEDDPRQQPVPASPDRPGNWRSWPRRSPGEERRLGGVGGGPATGVPGRGDRLVRNAGWEGWGAARQLAFLAAVIAWRGTPVGRGGGRAGNWRSWPR